MKTLLTTLNSSYVHSNLALRYLYTQAIADGIDAQLREYTVNTRHELIFRDILKLEPQLIAFSVYIWNVRATLDLCADIKKALPHMIIVLGGPEVSYNAAQVLVEYGSIDYILCGEVTRELSALIECLDAGAPVHDIPGIVMRTNNGIITNKIAVSAHFDALFPYKNSDVGLLENRILYYESSRGCPYRCSYCLSADDAVRYRDTQLVIKELDCLLASKPAQIKFIDRTFNVHKQHYLPIMRHLATLDAHTNFHCEIVAELICAELIDIVVAAPSGRFQFEIGLQSFHAPTLLAINRSNNYSDIATKIAALKATNKAHIHVDLIAGLPYEHYAACARSVNLAYALEPHCLQLGFLKLLKGTPLFNDSAQFGYAFSSIAPYGVISNNYLSAHEVFRLKAIEEVLELFFNAGRAVCALQYLTDIVGSAFSVYENIGDYWRANDLYMRTHRPEKLYDYLIAAVKGAYPKLFCDFELQLKRDVYLAEKSLIQGNKLWFDTHEHQERIKEFFNSEQLRAKYCSGYKLDSWRNLRNNFAIAAYTPNDVRLYDYREQITVETRLDASDFFGEIVFNYDAIQ